RKRQIDFSRDPLNDLCRLTLYNLKGCSPGFVAAHKFQECSLKNGDIERAPAMDGDQLVVYGALRLHLRVDPNLLLRIRERSMGSVSAPRNRCDAGLWSGLLPAQIKMKEPAFRIRKTRVFSHPQLLRSAPAKESKTQGEGASEWPLPGLGGT